MDLHKYKRVGSDKSHCVTLALTFRIRREEVWGRPPPPKLSLITIGTSYNQRFLRADSRVPLQEITADTEVE